MNNPGPTPGAFNTAMREIGQELFPLDHVKRAEDYVHSAVIHIRRELLADPLSHDAWRLRTLIARQALFTNSSRAQEILENFDEYLPRFYKVLPVEFRRALEEQPAAVGNV